MSADAAVRRRIGLTRLWRFHQGDLAGAQAKDYNDHTWRELAVPHDWAIEGPFTNTVDFQGGYLPVPGVGWYRTRVQGRPEAGRTYLEFDGVMRDATVWVNGKKAGGWFYGYSSFVLDVTRLVTPGENVIAVRVENEDESSRWYPGSGIYRNVWLTTTSEPHTPPWGTQVVSTIRPDGSAEVTVRTQVCVSQHPGDDAPEAPRQADGQHTANRSVVLQTILTDPAGKVVAEASTPANEMAESPADSELLTDPTGPDTQRVICEQRLVIEDPTRWDTTSPHLYQVQSRVTVDGVITDEYQTPFGVRTCRFDPDEGFFLNDRHVKLKGVNLHHDLGPLGAAVNSRATQRQLEIMKEMGANAIRCAHNPPSPELLDLCDQMGLLVIDENLDEWEENKKPNGYPSRFKEWAEQDTRAMVLRDRNHPSVILWSIGNEIPELGTPEGKANARRLTDICHDLDPTRPVTSGIHLTVKVDRELMDIIDVPGLNYWQDRYPELHRDYPDKCLISTESTACLSTRGEYHFPVREVYKEYRHQSKQITSYDVVNTGFGARPHVEFAMQEQPWMAGEFVWSGFDYHGEPDPYEDAWPAHSSYFGIVDMCGFPKDRYYLYQSLWTDRPVLHLLPHWTWPGREGELTPVYCYTNAVSAELWVNGVSAGRRTRESGEYHLRWDDVTYQPGSIRVVGYDAQGSETGETEVQTAGAPHHLALTADRTRISAGGEDLSFVTASVRDEAGRLCPDAEVQIAFSVDHHGEIAAVGNGNPIGLESYQSDTRRAFHGLCLLVARPTPTAGKIAVTATAPGLDADRIWIVTT